MTASLEKRRRLAGLAQQYSFWIVEDAPYRQLRYWGQELPTLWSLIPTRVLHMSSLSKVLAPGLRLGYLVSPADMVAKLARWSTDTYIGPVLPTQGMVYEYCCRGLLKPNIERLKAVYRPRLDATLSALQEHLPQASWPHPEGGFFVGVTLPETCDVAALQVKAREMGVVLSDGKGFFAYPDEGKRFLRIPFSRVTPAEIDAALARLACLL